MEILRLDVSEAAKFLGVQPITIRRAVKNGELNYIVVRGRYKINIESLLRWSQNRPRVAKKLAENGLGQYVEKWKIKSKLYSPNPGALEKKEK